MSVNFRNMMSEGRISVFAMSSKCTIRVLISLNSWLTRSDRYLVVSKSGRQPCELLLWVCQNSDLYFRIKVRKRSRELFMRMELVEPTQLVLYKCLSYQAAHGNWNTCTVGGI